MSGNEAHKAETRPKGLTGEKLPADIFSRIESTGHSHLPDPSWVEGAHLLLEEGNRKVYLLEKTQAQSSTSMRVFIVDYFDEKYAGMLEISYIPPDSTDVSEDKGFANVKYTKTEAEFQKQGLGMDRLISANRYVMDRWGVPLYSDSALSEEAQRLWERLVTEGRAESTGEARHKYRFKS